MHGSLYIGTSVKHYREGLLSVRKTSRRLSLPIVMLSVKTVSSSVVKEVSLKLLPWCFLLLLSTLSGAGSPLQPDGCYENERLRMGLQVAKSLLEIGVSLYTSSTVYTGREH